MRLAPVMLALLLALSPAVVAVQASAPVTASSGAVAADGTLYEETATSQSERNDTVTVVSLDSPARSEFTTPSLALGTLVQVDRKRVQSDLTTRALDEKLKRADTVEAKKSIILEYAFKIERSTLSLEAERKNALKDFRNGTLSARGLVVTLARIDSDADELRRLMRRLDRRASAIPQFSLESKQYDLKSKLVSLEGPVREKAGRALTGNGEVGRVYVSAGENGVVLATFTDTHYVREVYRDDNRDSGVPNRLSRSDVGTLINNTYPFAWEMQSFFGRDGRYGGHVYKTTLTYPSESASYPEGNITAYVDSGTGEIYREIQYTRTSGLESTVNDDRLVRNQTNNVTLTVGRSYPGGPTLVRLTNETGAPLDGQVTVGGNPVGRTGSDGVLWALSPAKQFRVSATYEGTTVNQTATPMESDYNSSED